MDEEWNIKERYPYIVTANAAYRKKVLEELGFFDGSLYSGGDVDMGWRVTKAGYNYYTHQMRLFITSIEHHCISFISNFLGMGDGMSDISKHAWEESCD